MSDFFLGGRQLDFDFIKHDGGRYNKATMTQPANFPLLLERVRDRILRIRGRDASPRRPGVSARRPYHAKNSVSRPLENEQEGTEKTEKRSNLTGVTGFTE